MKTSWVVVHNQVLEMLQDTAPVHSLVEVDYRVAVAAHTVVDYIVLGVDHRVAVVVLVHLVHKERLDRSP